jgi:maleylacetoacetate isomerase
MKIAKFYSYFRSSTAYRLRIALHYKGVTPQETVFVNLKEGEQHGQAYRTVNPAGAVPAFELEDGTVLTQSLAMLEWLEDHFPTPPLLPQDPTEKAQVRAAAQAIGCDIHPLNNLRVLKYLMQELGQGEDEKTAWIHHWVHRGFASLEEKIAKTAGECCFGDAPGLADICLIPQIYNAERFGVELGAYPTLMKINAHCLSLPYFEAAKPENQPDCNI